MTSVGDDVEKLEPSYSAGGNVKLCIVGKQFGNSEKLNMKLSNDPEILHVGIYQREMKTTVHTKTWAQVFRTVLFIIVKK